MDPMLLLAWVVTAFWPAAIVGLVLDGSLAAHEGWRRARRSYWSVVFGLALVNVAAFVAFVIRQLAGGYWMTITWIPIAAIPLWWIVAGTLRRLRKPPSVQEATGGYP